MALDTDAKKFSALNLMCPWRGPSILPAATVDNGTEMALLGLCSEFAVANAFVLTALALSYSWAVSDATLTATTASSSINTDARRFSAMNIMCPWRGPCTFPAPSITNANKYSLDYLYEGFAVNAVNNYVLTAQSVAYAWDVEPSFSDFEITADSVAYTWTVSPATLIATRTLSAGSVAFTWTVNDATLIKFATRTLLATTAAFSWVVNDATMTRPRSLLADSAVYSYVVREATFTWFDANGNPVKPGRGGEGEHDHHRHHPHRLTILQIHSEEDMLALLATMCAAGLFTRGGGE